MDNIQIKNVNNLKKTKLYSNKLISFVYSKIMKFHNETYQLKTLVTKDFFSGVLNILYFEVTIRYSHVKGKVIGYVHNFCKKRLRENRNLILVFSHYLFSFDIFFVVKGRRLCIWQTKLFGIGVTNLIYVRYASTSNHVKFIDTIKYYQQSLSSVAATANDGRETKNNKI